MAGGLVQGAQLVVGVGLDGGQGMQQPGRFGADDVHGQLVVAGQRSGDGAQPGLDHGSELSADRWTVKAAMPGEGL